MHSFFCSPGTIEDSVISPLEELNSDSWGRVGPGGGNL